MVPSLVEHIDPFTSQFIGDYWQTLQASPPSSQARAVLTSTLVPHSHPQTLPPSPFTQVLNSLQEQGPYRPQIDIGQ